MLEKGYRVTSSYLALPNPLVEFPAPTKKVIGHQEYPFSLVGNTDIYKRKKSTTQNIYTFACFLQNKRLLKARKTPRKEVRLLNSCTWLQKFHITKTNQYDPYTWNASRWMKKKIKSSTLCFLDHIEEEHLLGLPPS